MEKMKRRDFLRLTATMTAMGYDGRTDRLRIEYGRIDGR